MCKKFAIKNNVSIFVINKRFSNAKKKTRIFVKNRKNDQLTTNMFFSTRAFKRCRLIIILLLFQSIVTRNRSENNNTIKKLLNKNIVVVENFLLFLS